MPHFKFQVAHGSETAVTDEEFASADEVRLEAIYDAREMLVEGIMEGEDRSGWRMAVMDQEGQTVLELPFSEAFEG